MRRRHLRPGSIAALLGAACILACAAGARADAVKCRAAIIKSAASFREIQAKTVGKCREAIVKRKLPVDTDCTASDALVKASTKLRRKIGEACGGADKTCGTVDDQALASIGWNISNCPDFNDGECFLPIHDCGDIGSCFDCIDPFIVQDALGTAYDKLVPSDPKTQKALNKCQVAIGKETVKFFAAKSKALAACWSAVNKGKATAPCPIPGDGKAEVAIAKAEANLITAICKVCGGADRKCGTNDDLTPASIGSLACPPRGGCGGAIATLQDLVSCVSCVAGLDMDCADRNAVPGLGAYPTQCSPPPTSGSLDFTKNPTFGTLNLLSGFKPDPATVPGTSGGSVDVSYLAGCTGFATSAPSVRINYGGSGASLLRIYFIGNGGDTMMVINDPYGNIFCVDNSFATVNPTLDFPNPVGGAYDVWVGSRFNGTFISGTLFVTETSSNHP